MSAAAADGIAGRAHRARPIMSDQVSL